MVKGLMLDQVRIRLGDALLVEVNAHVEPGNVLTIMGPSGSGKSTLLAHVIGTLAKPFEATGRVLLNGQDLSGLSPERRRIGILFQDDLLFPHLSVGGNLGFGLRPGGTAKERAIKIKAALEEVDLAGFADRDPSTLSGGQKARVALMRMLLSEPCALVLDEPFSGLDSDLRKQVREVVFSRARARNLPVLLVTHDIDDARATGGTVITLGRPSPHE